MKYYKKWLDDEERYQYEERDTFSDDISMIEISQSEYEFEVAKQWEEYIASTNEEYIECCEIIDI